MSATIRVADQGIVETTYAGHLAAAQLVAAVLDTQAAARAHGTALGLAICRDVESVPSFGHLLRDVPILAHDNPLRRVAIVLPTRQAVAEFVRFWGAASQAQGVETQVFSREDDARRWLVATPVGAATSASPAGAGHASWRLACDEGGRFLELTYTGMVDPQDLLDASRATVALAAVRGTTAVLADCTALTGGHSVFDLYDVARTLERFGAASQVREAVVLPRTAAMADTVRFWVTTAANSGMHVRLFDTRDAAAAWLTA